MWFVVSNGFIIFIESRKLLQLTQLRPQVVTPDPASQASNKAWMASELRTLVMATGKDVSNVTNAIQVTFQHSRCRFTDHLASNLKSYPKQNGLLVPTNIYWQERKNTSVYIYVCVDILICIYILIYIYIILLYILIYIYMYVCILMYVYIYIYTCLIYTLKHVYLSVYSYAYIYIIYTVCTYICIYLYICTYIRILLYMYLYMYLHIWVNYNISLAWIKAIWGWLFPLLTMISSKVAVRSL